VVTAKQDFPRSPPTNFAESLSFLVHRDVVFDSFTNPIFVDADGDGDFDPPGI
jgi:hypothetical protein